MFLGKRTAALDTLHLTIKECGSLKFPLSSREIKKLIKVAQPAKFGWRNKTLLDKKVRDAWEISQKQIKITNPWNKTLNKVIDGLKSDLGLPQTAVLKASLHNLLIYQPGQFFDPHQDSEKLKGMIATLVVVLPSAHKGGPLVVDNQGVKKVFYTANFALNELTFIAFYADCHHQVKAIQEGYRVALTYNLVLENSAQIPPPSLSLNDELVESVKNYFAKQNEFKGRSYLVERPKKLVYLLDH